MGATWVMMALWAGCNEQNTAEPVEAAKEAPAAEPVAEKPAAAPAPGELALPARGDDAERASKNGELTHKIGDVAISVGYGRPKVNGREIFGALVPYGEVWRTGANEATAVLVSEDVTVEGQPLPKGVYGLFTIPGEQEWTVIFNKNANQWGAGSYDPSMDAVRVTAKPEASDAAEAFEITGTQTGIALRWAEVAVPVNIAAATSAAAAEGEH